MIIVTATGKEFSSDYAVTLRSPPRAFIRIVGEDIEKIREIFSSSEELPLEDYEPYKNIASITDEDTAVKIILMP